MSIDKLRKLNRGGWDVQLSDETATGVLKEFDAVVAERDAALKRVAELERVTELLRYTEHKRWCAYVRSANICCDCGLSDAISEVKP